MLIEQSKEWCQYSRTFGIDCSIHHYLRKFMEEINAIKPFTGDNLP